MYVLKGQSVKKHNIHIYELGRNANLITKVTTRTKSNVRLTIELEHNHVIGVEYKNKQIDSQIVWVPLCSITEVIRT